MWNSHNRALVERYGSPSSVPTDAEYGEYIMRELLTLGYAVKRLQMAGGNHFVIAVDQMHGAARAVLFCKAARGMLDDSSVRMMLSLRPMCKAQVYGVLTNGTLSDQARRMLVQNHVIPLEEYRIGCEVLHILSDMDLLPPALGQRFAELVAVEENRVRIQREEKRKQEELQRRQAEEAAAARQKAEMSPFEKYQAGLLSPRISEAIGVVSLMDVVSTGGLARKLHTDQEEAGELLMQLAALGIIGPAERSKPRQVLMTPGMIEKKFGIRVRSGLR